jgi:hypothetical protein
MMSPAHHIRVSIVMELLAKDTGREVIVNIKKRISVRVHTYNHRSKKRISELSKRYLSGTPLEEHESLIGTCINELLTNAVKANYKYMVMSEAKEGESPDDASGNGPGSYDDDRSVARRVREILNEQARFNDIVDRVDNEERLLSDKERAMLSEFTVYNAISERVRRDKIVSSLTLELADEALHLSVGNTAPILQDDLERIREKLDCIRRLRSEGREHDFFSQHMDTSQGGFGFGYALIDSCCRQMGVDTGEVLTIHAGAETTVEIVFPLKRIAMDPGEVEFIEVA